jgi:hypothetical protein
MAPDVHNRIVRRPLSDDTFKGSTEGSQVGSLAEAGMGGLQDSNAGPFKSSRIAICANSGDDRRRDGLFGERFDPPGGHAMKVYISFIHRSPVK